MQCLKLLTLKRRFLVATHFLLANMRRAAAHDADEAINNEERPFQRQNLQLEADAMEVSLDDINDHCILEILGYFSVEELNSAIVFISQRYHDLRNHDSLDQTRTGTIMCTENTNLEKGRFAVVPRAQTIRLGR